VKAVVVIGLVTGLLLTTAGCTSDDDEKGGTPAAKASRSAAVAASASSAAAVATGDLNTAVQELTRTSYKYTLKAGDASGGGTVDPAAKQSSLTVTIDADEDFKTEVLLLDTELYLRISGLPLPGLDGQKWFKIDRSRIKSFTALGIQDVDDPSGVKTLAKTIATIQKTGDRSYKGTLDLTKGSTAFGLDEAAARALGDKAKAVPFEATVNEQGKLATWKMVIPAHGTEKETPFDLTYSEHGGKFPLTKPADAAAPPDAVYDILQA